MALQVYSLAPRTSIPYNSVSPAIIAAAKQCRPTVCAGAATDYLQLSAKRERRLRTKASSEPEAAPAAAAGQVTEVNKDTFWPIVKTAGDKIVVLDMYTQCVDEGFPVITFQFENSLPLPVYPHNYLFEVRDTEYCIGWQVSGMQALDGQELTLLGDIALLDKLVVYDLENQTIGWAQYNCSSSIKVRDNATGNAYDIVAHDISFDSTKLRANIVSTLVLVAAVLGLIG